MLLSLLLLSAPLVSFGAAPQDDRAAAEQLRQELERHVKVLAADELKGRLAGTAENRLAAKYLVEQLEAAGWKGGAADGSFRQEMPVVLLEHKSAPRLIFTRNTGEKEEGVYGEDFNLILRGPAASTGELPILRVVEQEDLPRKAQPDTAVFFRCSPVERTEWLSMWGQGKAEGWGLDLQIGRSEDKGARRPPPARTALFEEDAVEACEIVTVRGKLRESLIWKGYKAVELIVEEERTDVVEANVIALLPGTDPERRDEIVLVTAGYDGLGEAGIGARLDQEDRIRNGAHAASAVATMLELAEARAAAGDNARTLAFVFTTGTPKFRHGWTRFLTEPPFPLENVVAAFVLDGLGLRDIGQISAGEVMMTGMQRTDLGESLVERGLRFVPDPYPDAVFDKRGPHKELARLGIPAHWLFTASPNAKRNQWEDEAERLDFDHLRQVTSALDTALGLLGDGTLSPSVKIRKRGG